VPEAGVPDEGTSRGDQRRACPKDAADRRRLSPVEAGRVKAYQREGVLPPVLRWFVSGLDSLVVIDVQHLEDGGAGLFGDEHLARAGQRLAAELANVERSEVRTRAWPIPGGRAAWGALAAGFAPGSPLWPARRA
jgi:hypothetical protein